MSGRTRILLIDSSTSDLELASLLLQQALPQAAISGASNMAALLELLRGTMPEIIIVAPRPDWVGLDDVPAMVRSIWPRSALILFGREDEIAQYAQGSASALDGIAIKSSAGFMALPTLVRTVLDRSPTPRGALDDWPLPAVRVSADGHIIEASASFGAALEVAVDDLIGAPLPDRLASGEHERWVAIRSGATTSAALKLMGVDGLLRVKRDTSGELLGCLVESSASLCTPAPPPPHALPAPAAPAVPAAKESATLRELQDMALIFSHDLKEPMQQVARLVRRIEDARESDTPSEDKVLRQLSDCAARATGMLDGLLVYLSVSGRETEPAPVDLNLCLDEAMENLCSAIEESQARISADPLPSVVGDAVQMVHLFQNLLGNAIKFRSSATPLVHISCHPHDNVYRIAVHDNGIGISEAHRERVFEMGKRLHTQAEFPGTGMGLTLCRRIAERHGGSIHIEAAPRGGSVVVMELPQDVAAAPACARIQPS